jgi:hypothetical protein
VNVRDSRSNMLQSCLIKGFYRVRVTVVESSFKIKEDACRDKANLVASSAARTSPITAM